MPVPPSGPITGAADAGETATSAASARLEELFRTLRPKIAANIRARFPNLSWADAEDVVVEAFVYAFRNWERIGARENLAGYVTLTAHHKAIDLLRGRQREVLADGGTLAALLDDTGRNQVSDESVDSELWSIVHQAITGLKGGSLRRVVSLQAAGSSDADIAAALEIPAHRLHSDRSKAINKLRKQLGSYIRDSHARKQRKPEATSKPLTSLPATTSQRGSTPPTAAKAALAPKRKGRPGVSPDEAAAVMRKAGFEPLEPYPGSNARWRCRCITCSKEVMPRYGTAKKGHGCRYCAGQVVSPEAALTVMRERGLEPIGAYPGATKKWAYTCLTCGHEGITTYHSVKSQASGCIVCGRHQAGARQRLSRAAAASVMRHGGYEPLEDYPGSGAPWRCQCTTCGVVATPTYDNVKSGHRCSTCARTRQAAEQQGRAPWPAIDSQQGVDAKGSALEAAGQSGVPGKLPQHHYAPDTEACSGTTTTTCKCPGNTPGPRNYGLVPGA
ncbi:RNA polymerase sigma factor [Streptomyces globosus]|uniref:RNA polymerase sigma factor n=1 Tax=Streptomyces TaxID=1883 RepID=UPI003810B012